MSWPGRRLAPSWRQRGHPLCRPPGGLSLSGHRLHILLSGGKEKRREGGKGGRREGTTVRGYTYYIDIHLRILPDEDETSKSFAILDFIFNLIQNKSR